MHRDLLPPDPPSTPEACAASPAPARHTPASERRAAQLRPEQRRREVARRALARIPIDDIARELGVAQRTVFGDLRRLRTEWRRDAATDLATRIAQECAVLESDEAYWRAQLAACTPDDRAHALRIYDRIAAIMDRRARWLGIATAPAAQAAESPLEALLRTWEETRHLTELNVVDAEVVQPPTLPPGEAP
ncbi:MAG TPA: hypothetical protein VM536_03785 [Chloroflexia bacterium]|nr:hypothetical protein [Chloroflexia bacterium]